MPRIIAESLYPCIACPFGVVDVYWWRVEDDLMQCRCCGASWLYAMERTHHHEDGIDGHEPRPLFGGGLVVRAYDEDSARERHAYARVYEDHRPRRMP
jgi:hypothetical protein